MTEWLMQGILERCKTRPKLENLRTLEKQGELKTIVQHLYAINQPDFILVPHYSKVVPEPNLWRWEPKSTNT